jgi:outer membrane biosynthesis protein TonB
MTADRAEWTGIGAALLFHVALIAALSTSLASIKDAAEPPSMEVELVDEVGLEAAAPTPIPQPAAAAPPPMPSEAVPPPLPQPTVAPLPPQRPMPQATARPAPPQPTARPALRPPRPIQRAPAQPARRPGIGDDFLKSFDDDLAPRAGPARPAAATFSTKARASVASSIATQAQRCADRQPYLGEGADQLQVQVRLSFARSGRLSRPPQIASISGDSDLRSKYGELLEDQVRRIFADCSPFRLPADLYDTDNGGWKETTLRYRVRK